MFQNIGNVVFIGYFSVRLFRFKTSMLESYVKKILKARVYEIVDKVPLDEAVNLSLRTGNTILLKREDLQPVFSFKLRRA